MKTVVRKQFEVGIVCSISLLLLFSSPANALDVKTYEELKRTSLSKEILKSFILGLGEGYSWSNTFLKKRGDRNLYCAPNIVLNAENHINIIDSQIAFLKKSNTPLQTIMETPVEILLYIGLVDSFPCSK